MLKYLRRITQIASGDHKLSRGAQYLTEISSVFARDNIVFVFIQCIQDVETDERQQIINLINKLLQWGGGLEESLARQQGVVFSTLISHYRTFDLALICGQFLRDLISSPILHLKFLQLDNLQVLGFWAQDYTFEISSDAFETLKLLVVTEARFVKDFILENALGILEIIFNLLGSQNYFVRRSIMHLFSNFVQKVPNFVQIAVSNKNNLKYIMNMLKQEQSTQIGEQAMVIFSHMTQAIVSDSETYADSYKIIFKNKERIIKLAINWPEMNDTEVEERKDFLIYHMYKFR